jgi:ankyrin repeat protein
MINKNQILIFISTIICFNCNTKKMDKIEGKNYFDEKYYAIIDAIDNEDIETLENLVNQSNINTIGKQNLTFVYYSFFLNKKSVFDFFIAHNTNVNIPFKELNGDSSHLINLATELDDNYYFTRLVTYKNTNLNVKDSKGMAPIQNAIMVNNDQRVIELIERGVDINTQDHWGQTPVYMLCDLQNFELAFELIKRGADAKIKDSNESSVALIIQEAKFPETTKAFMWQQKIKEELIKQGVIFPVKRPWENN